MSRAHATHLLLTAASGDLGQRHVLASAWASGVFALESRNNSVLHESKHESESLYSYVHCIFQLYGFMRADSGSLLLGLENE